MKRVPTKPSALLLALIFTFFSATTSGAHQPVTLNSSHAKSGSSPILVDGTISFAIYASMTSSSPARSFRFYLTQGERLDLQYLILDQRPENQLASSNLPVVSYTSPKGKVVTMKINERTSFFEPFSQKKYLYLSRISSAGEEGVYTVTIRAKRNSSVVIAVGTRETPGLVLNVGTGSGQCPIAGRAGTEIAMSAANQILGMSERSAQACAAAQGWGFRVVARDGEEFPVTLDYRMDRINVTVVSNKVTEVTIG